MSKRQSTIEIYSLDDFRKADRIGRIRMYMMEPDKFALNDRDHEYYRQLTQAYQLVFEEMRQSLAIRAIQEAIPGAESWHMANSILRDVYGLFSPFLVKNKEVRRAILVEKLYMMAKVAEGKAMSEWTDEQGKTHPVADIEWMKMAESLYVQAGKMEGLDQHDVAMINPDEIQIPNIEITADPAAFLSAQIGDQEEAEDDEFDD